MLTVCITGPDGAGKTTQVALLADRLADAGRSVAVTGIWDALDDPDYGGLVPFSDAARTDAYLALLEPLSRMYFLAHALREAHVRAAAREPDVLVLNAHWYKYLATEVAHGGDPAALRAVVRPLPAPDATVLLDVPIATAARRKARYSGYETGFADERSPAAFAAFQEPAHRTLDVLSRELGWTVLDGEAPIDALADRIAAAFDVPVATGRAGR